MLGEPLVRGADIEVGAFGGPARRRLSPVRNLIGGPDCEHYEPENLLEPVARFTTPLTVITANARISRVLRSFLTELGYAFALTVLMATVKRFNGVKVSQRRCLPNAIVSGRR